MAKLCAVVSRGICSNRLVELYKLSGPTLFFIPLGSNLTCLNYVQLSPGTVVAWAIVTHIRASFVTG